MTLARTQDSPFHTSTQMYHLVLSWHMLPPLGKDVPTLSVEREHLSI